jgi:hypothetical protein
MRTSCSSGPAIYAVSWARPGNYRYLVESKLGHAPRAVLATPKLKPEKPVSGIRERWALVVGISSFTDKNIRELPYTSADAKAFRDVLVDPKLGGFKPEDVRLLTDQGANLPDIKKG